MSEPRPTSLDRAKQTITEAMAIMCDYLKLAADIHPPGQFAPTVLVMQSLTDALREIENLHIGLGCCGGTAYSGGIPVD